MKITSYKEVFRPLTVAWNNKSRGVGHLWTKGKLELPRLRNVVEEEEKRELQESIYLVAVCTED
jgi:hypothetical protein